MSKISFRFFNDRPVRAVWDEENSKWWFSVPDVVGVLNAQDDYTKNRNYWKYLKNKLKASAPQLVSATNQLKMMAAEVGRGIGQKVRHSIECTYEFFQFDSVARGDVIGAGPIRHDDLRF